MDTYLYKHVATDEVVEFDEPNPTFGQSTAWELIDERPKPEPPSGDQNELAEQLHRAEEEIADEKARADKAEAELEAMRQTAAEAEARLADAEQATARAEAEAAAGGGDDLPVDWHALTKAELEAEASKRGLEVTGTGSNGNVLVGDLADALKADDAKQD
jgi:multidrug efflux pump subunit AcrA (membrane-fusion protein)